MAGKKTDPIVQDEVMDRRDLFKRGFARVATMILGFIGGFAAGKTRRDDNVWQLDPDKCVQCGKCSTECVLNPSAVKCIQSYPICGYCDLCFGYFEPDAAKLTSSAENQLCPTGAIKRTFIEDPYWDYTIAEEECIGCSKCVEACEVFGNASFHLQIRHDVCINCNECSIAKQCPADAFTLLPADTPYFIRGQVDPYQKKTTAEAPFISLDLEPAVAPKKRYGHVSDSPDGPPLKSIESVAWAKEKSQKAGEEYDKAIS